MKAARQCWARRRGLGEDVTNFTSDPFIREMVPAAWRYTFAWRWRGHSL